MGMNGLGIALGYALATYVGLGFFYSSNQVLQWRGSYGIALIFSFLPLVAMFFVPESPRWLLMVNRVDDAKKTVRKLHNLTNEEEHHFAMAEFYQMHKQIEYDRTVEPSWIKMFTRRSYRKRLIMTCVYSFLAQSTGILGKSLGGDLREDVADDDELSTTMDLFFTVLSDSTARNSSSMLVGGLLWGLAAI